jgi:hypothetical protein
VASAVIGAIPILASQIASLVSSGALVQAGQFVVQELSKIGASIGVGLSQIIESTRSLASSIPGGQQVVQAMDAFMKTVKGEAPTPPPVQPTPPAPPLYTVSASWTVEVTKTTFDVNRFISLLNSEIKNRLSAMGYEATTVTTDIILRKQLDRIAIDATTNVQAKQPIDKNKLLDVLKWAIPSVCAVLGLSIIAGPGGQQVTEFVGVAGGIIIVILLLLLLWEREKRKR